MWVKSSTIPLLVVGLVKLVAGQNAIPDNYIEVGQDYVKFLEEAIPSPFHAVKEAARRLSAQGFKKLSEKASWNKEIQPNGKYFVVRDDSSLVAFAVGGNFVPGNGFSIVGSHTDSPALKLKPNWNKDKAGYGLAGFETYGGGLWHTWIDRNLGIAGKVITQEGGKYKAKLVNVNKPVLYIPSLPVELNTANSKTNFIKLNKETSLIPFTGLSNARNGKANPGNILWAEIAAQAGVPADKILSFELSAYNLQKPTLGGLRNEFVLSGRQDDLYNTYCNIEGLLSSLGDDSLQSDTNVRISAIFDNEEVGSNSRHGAGSNLLPNVISRVVKSQLKSNDPTAYDRSISNSVLVSADQGLADHPNYPNKLEAQNTPIMNAGPVIYVSASQKFGTNAQNTLILQKSAEAANMTLQTFVFRNDGGSGSTIGPLISSLTGIQTVDMGTGQLSMHSTREMSGTIDVQRVKALFASFFKNHPKISQQLDFDS